MQTAITLTQIKQTSPHHPYSITVILPYTPQGKHHKDPHSFHHSSLTPSLSSSSSSFFSSLLQFS
ncbi:hypothetical protein E2C01_048706 [Portunus trituberculatus]|uniref:Uncharacterized protein n=1 Tax=Portunus trituberculatus TaxID=210409 RepID=A0A5B7G3S8_PORTR|nr:hypothetical protein [Portunus trituberculatus]